MRLCAFKALTACAVFVVSSLAAAVGRRSQALSSSIASLECYGKSGKANVLFLHGMDDLISNELNVEATLTMKRVARELDLKLALPRSNLRCAGGKKLCWNVHSKPQEIRQLFAELERESGRCFGPGKLWITIGFSNGGYFLNKAARHCLIPAAMRVVSIGAGGTQAKSPGELSHCASLDMLVARDEPTYSEARLFFTYFQKSKGIVRFTSFSGGHHVPYGELKSLMKTLLGGEGR